MHEFMIPVGIPLEFAATFFSALHLVVCWSLDIIQGGRRGSVGKASGLRPRGREFEPQPGHYVCNLWAGLLNLHSPEQAGQCLL